MPKNSAANDRCQKCGEDIIYEPDVECLLKVSKMFTGFSILQCINCIYRMVGLNPEFEAAKDLFKEIIHDKKGQR